MWCYIFTKDGKETNCNKTNIKLLHSCLIVVKAELSAILNIFNDVLTKYGMTLSAEKSSWMTLGCCIDELDREAIQLPCGSVRYFSVESTSDLADTADIDAKLSRGRSTLLYIIVKNILLCL